MIKSWIDIQLRLNIILYLFYSVSFNAVTVEGGKNQKILDRLRTMIHIQKNTLYVGVFSNDLVEPAV